MTDRQQTNKPIASASEDRPTTAGTHSDSLARDDSIRPRPMPTPPPPIAAAPASSRFLHARSQAFHPCRILCRGTLPQEKTVRKLIEEERFGAIKMCNFSACEQVIGAEMLSDCNQLCGGVGAERYGKDLFFLDWSMALGHIRACHM